MENLNPTPDLHERQAFEASQVSDEDKSELGRLMKQAQSQLTLEVAHLPESVKKELDELRARTQSQQNELSRLTREKVDLGQKIVLLEDQNQFMSSRLETADKPDEALTKALGQASTLANQNRDLNWQVSALTSENGSMKQRLEESETAVKDFLLARVAELEVQKDNAYAERNLVVSLAAKLAVSMGYEAGLYVDPDHKDDPSWTGWTNVVYINLPTGQVTWHIYDGELPIFTTFLRVFNRDETGYDAHSTEEKYRRIRQLPRLRGDYTEGLRSNAFGDAQLRSLALADIQDLFYILAELVDLKRHKDEYGKDVYYEGTKADVWKRAGLLRDAYKFGLTGQKTEQILNRIERQGSLIDIMTAALQHYATPNILISEQHEGRGEVADQALALVGAAVYPEMESQVIAQSVLDREALSALLQFVLANLDQETNADAIVEVVAAKNALNASWSLARTTAQRIELLEGLYEKVMGWLNFRSQHLSAAIPGQTPEEVAANTQVLIGNLTAFQQAVLAEAGRINGLPVGMALIIPVADVLPLAEAVGV